MNIISNQIESILTKKQLEEDYANLGSLSAIAKKYNISDVAIRSRFIKYGIQFKSKNQNNKCKHNIFSNDTEESFYLAGFIAADGCVRISTNKKGYTNCRIIIGLSKKDEKHLELIRELFQSNHKFSYYIHKLSKKSPKWNDSKSVTLSITSKKMVEDLKRFNIMPCKSLIYTMPEWMKEHPLKKHFIRGYIDGDGSFYKTKNNNNITMSIRGTIQFLQSCKDIFEKECMITLNSTPKIQNKIGIFKVHSNIKVSRIVDFLHSTDNICMERKYEKACESIHYVTSQSILKSSYIKKHVENRNSNVLKFYHAPLYSNHIIHTPKSLFGKNSDISLLINNVSLASENILLGFDEFIYVNKNEYNLINEIAEKIQWANTLGNNFTFISEFDKKNEGYRLSHFQLKSVQVIENLCKRLAKINGFA